MFDLFRSRDKAVRILLGVILGLVAISMVTYLIPNNGMSASSTGDNVVAQVGDETITVQAAQRAIQGVLRGGQVPSQYLGIYAPQIVQQLVGERAIAYEAKRQGLRVTDEDVNVAIQNQLPPAFFQDGKLVKRQELEAALGQQGMTISDLKTETARQLLVTRLRDIALEGTVVSPAEVEKEYRQRSEKVKIDYVILSPAKYQPEVKIDTPAMQGYYDKNKGQFQIPARKSVAYVVFDGAQMETSIPATDADLQKQYNAELDKYRVPERVHARHILFRTDQPTAKDADQRAKAEGVLKQLRSGADFAELAKKNSEDPGSGAKGGDLGWVLRGQMVKPFEDAVFSLKPNELSNLVKTQYGYHIVQDLEKESAHLRSFDEVKGELATNYKKQRVNNLTQQNADKAIADFRRDPAHPEKAAADVNQPLQKAENMVPGDPLPMLGVSKEFETAVSSLQKNEVSQPIVLPNNKVAVAVVTGGTPAHPASFAEAQPDIRKALQSQGLEVLLTQKASDLLAKTKENGGDLKKAASSMGLEMKTSADFDRAGAVEGVGSATLMPDAFTKPVGTVFGPIRAEDNRVIGKVVAKTEANMAQFTSQSASIRDEIKSRRARERNVIFEDGVRQKLTKDGKVKIHQDVVNRIIAAYRS